MIPKTISAILVCVLLHSSVVAESAEQSQTQTVTNMQQVLHKAQERNKGVKVTLRKKIDNQRKFTGSIVEISDASFAISEQKSGKTMNFRYEDVQQVGQSGVSKGAIIALVAVAAAGVIILALVVHEVGK